MATGEINFDHAGIGTILAHNRLVVPLNQREYSWEVDHAKELFQDFSNALVNNKGSYFLGTIVLTKGGGGNPEVSDGQQRLATTTILTAAVRDLFFNQGDFKRAGVLADKYLRTVDLKTTETVPRLRLNVDDQEFFRKRVISDPDSPERGVTPTRQSHRRITDAADAARLYLVDFLKPYKETAYSDRLIELIGFIESGAQVIALRVPDHINAFVMFETLTIAV